MSVEVKNISSRQHFLQTSTNMLTHVILFVLVYGLPVVLSAAADVDLTRQLHAAVLDKNLSAVRSLLADHAGDLGFVDGLTPAGSGGGGSSFAITPLIQACFGGHSDIVRELLTSGNADPNVKTSHGYAATFVAADQGHLAIIKILVEGGADVNAANGPIKETALMRAANNAMVDLVEYLILNGANVDLRQSHGLTALFYGVAKNNLNVVKLLVSLGGANTNLMLGSKDKGQTALMLASEEGHLEIVQFLIANGNADPNIRSQELGQTAVYKSCDHGHFEVVKYLANQASANVYILDKRGCSSFHAAAFGGYLDIVRFFVNKLNTDVNQKSCFNSDLTALQASAGNGQGSVVDFLLKHGAQLEIDHKNRANFTAMYLATHKGYVDIVKMLLEAGALVDATNGLEKQTALHMASREGHYNLVLYLVEEAGSNVLVTNAEGLTPLKLAERSNRVRVAKYLRTKEVQDILLRSMVRLGDGDLNVSIDIQMRFIKDKSAHPNFSLPYFDVAVITLSSPINSTSRNVNMICLPNSPSDNIDEFEGHQMDVAGWGLVSKNAVKDNQLRQVQQKVFSNRFCNASHAQTEDVVIKNEIERYLFQYFTPDLMCAGYEFGGSGSCQGDSGGPLMKYTYFDGPSSAQYVQQGIVQGGIGSCGSKDFPSIYVRVRNPEVLKFIKGTVAGAYTKRMEDLAYQLFDAVERNDIIAAKTILRENEDDTEGFVNLKLPMEIDPGNRVEATPLHKACLDAKTSIALILVLEGRADVHALSSDGNIPAHYAVRGRHLDTLKALAENSDLDVNLPYGKDGTTLLMAASHRNIPPIVDYLISAGASVDQVGDNGFTALFYACGGRHYRVARSLVLRGGADVNLLHTGWTPLMEVASVGDLPLVKLFIEEAGGKPNLKTPAEGHSSFFLACALGHTEVVRYLLKESNADLESKTYKRPRFSPLGVAIVAGFLEIVEMLIAEGVDVNAECQEFGITPLQTAAVHGHPSIVEYLVNAGAKVDLLQHGGFAALCMTTDRGYLNVVKILIELGGANKDLACGKQQWTALHSASKHGYYDIVVYLVKEAGANVSVKTGDGGKTALEVAEEYKQDRIAQFLRG